MYIALDPKRLFGGSAVCPEDTRTPTPSTSQSNTPMHVRLAVSSAVPFASSGDSQAMLAKRVTFPAQTIVASERHGGPCWLGLRAAVIAR